MIVEYDKYYMVHIYEIPRVVKFMETESRIAITRGWGRVELGVLLMGMEFQLGRMNKI